MVRDLEDFRARSKGALEKWKASQAKIKERDVLPAAGDIYIFSATAEIGVEWVIVLQHIDDVALWFMVPFDQNPMAGTWDVPVAESSEAGPGTLRCSRGIWIHVDDIGIGSRSGFLELRYVERAKAKLAAIVDPNSDHVKARHEVDFDPDYEEWINEISAAAERLEAQLRAEPEVISVADFNTAWTSFLPSRSFQAADMSMLVAESSGLAAGTNDQVSDSAPGQVIATNLPGTLVALLDGNSIRLLYLLGDEKSAPTILAGSSELQKTVAWRVLPGGVIESTEAFADRPLVIHLPCGTKEIRFDSGR